MKKLLLQFDMECNFFNDFVKLTAWRWSRKKKTRLLFKNEEFCTWCINDDFGPQPAEMMNQPNQLSHLSKFVI